MIDPVNISNRGYYEYGKINTEMGKGMENHEKFALGYDSTEKDSNQRDDKKSVKEKDGVVVEFSNQSKEQYQGVGNDNKKAGNTQDAFDMSQTMEQAKGFIGNLIKAVAELWNGFKSALVAFWNSDNTAQQTDEAEQAVDMIESTAQELAEGEEFAEGVVPQEVEGTRENATAGLGMPGTGAMTAQTDIPQPRVARIYPVDDTEEKMRQAEEFFASQKYVKNSDLLTYYDKSGRLVQLSGTDKNRILHGNKNPGRGL